MFEEKQRENKKRIESLIANVGKSTKANGREIEGVFVVSVLGGGSRQVSVFPLALFTRQAERGGETCR